MNLRPFELAIVYFMKAPFIIGEFLLIGGILVVINGGLLGFIGIAGGSFLIYRKVAEMLFAIKATTKGEKGQARLIRITDSGYEHNDRKVKSYLFEYEIDSKTYHFTKKSAYARTIEYKKTFTFFYLKNQTQKIFLPAFFGINRFE